MITVQFNTSMGATVTMIALFDRLQQCDKIVSRERADGASNDDTVAHAFEMREIANVLEQLAKGLNEGSFIVRQYRAMLGQLKNKELIDHIIG